MLGGASLGAIRQPLETGALLLGRYRVQKTVGRGAMGVVLAARDEELHVDVAIKVLVGMEVAMSEPVERFMREARIAVKLKSEHVVRVMDAGTLETGTPFMVMELLEGFDLSSESALPHRTAVDYVLQAIDAIAEAHTHRIIHRDLKPSNLFLAKRRGAPPIIKVLDFGISKAQNLDGDPTLTTAESILGSPRYMPPEQFRSAKLVDERTDVWALGAIMYTLLSGAPPFDGTSIGEVFTAVLQDEPAPLRASRPEIPAELESVVLRCLSKDPNGRFSTVAKLAVALAPFGSGEWQRCVARAEKLLEQQTASLPYDATVLDERSGVHAARPKDPKWPTLLGIALTLGCLLFLGATGATGSGRGQQPELPPAAPPAMATVVETLSPLPPPEKAPPAAPSASAPAAAQGVVLRVPNRAPAAAKFRPTAASTVASPAPVLEDAGASPRGSIFDDRH